MLCCLLYRLQGLSRLSDGLLIVLAIIVVVIVYVAAKVVHFARKSEQQWTEVDKSKLKSWDDDDWDSG